jgi:hypothetical protein
VAPRSSTAHTDAVARSVHDSDGQGNPRGSEQRDEVSFGPSRPPRLRVPRWLNDSRWAAWMRRHRWVPTVVALAVAAAVAVPVAVTATGPRGAPRPASSYLVTILPGYPRIAAVVPSHQVTVTRVRHPLLGVRAGWELFGYGQAGLVRIQLARGLITTTTVPPLQSSGAVYLVAGPSQAVIRPLDFVPGYLVPDGRPARALPGSLAAGGGPALPGPRAGTMWAQPRQNGPGTVMSLMSFAGQQLGPSIRLPASAFFPQADGRGYLAFQCGAAVCDARPGRISRVATGELVATGPVGLLVERCQRDSPCQYVLVHPAGGLSRVVPGSAPNGQPPAGMISPNGRFAALLSYGRDQTLILNLLSLVTGADRRVNVALSDNGPGNLAWAPDSNWLFAATETGSLIAIDPQTLAVRGLGVSLPPVAELAIRSG